MKKLLPSPTSTSRKPSLTWWDSFSRLQFLLCKQRSIGGPGVNNEVDSDAGQEWSGDRSSRNVAADMV
jgi:hypothetical protein